MIWLLNYVETISRKISTELINKKWRMLPAWPSVGYLGSFGERRETFVNTTGGIYR